MRKSYLLGVGVIGAAVLATMAWVLLGSPALTEAQATCTDSEPVESYDLTHYVYDKGGEIKTVIRVNGKMLHKTSSVEFQGRLVGGEYIFDGVDTVYIRHFPLEQFEREKPEDPDSYDISEDSFPYGGEYLCPDLEALGAKYENTDSVGKRYVIDAEKEWDKHTLWVDDDGWLLRVDKYDGDHSYLFTGRGENNEIEIPQPPYLEIGN